jgi:hypothetical protein
VPWSAPRRHLPRTNQKGDEELATSHRRHRALRQRLGERELDRCRSLIRTQQNCPNGNAGEHTAREGEGGVWNEVAAGIRILGGLSVRFLILLDKAGRLA